MRRKLGSVLLLSIIAGGIIFFVVPKKTLRNLYLYTKGSRFVQIKTEPVLAIFDRNKKGLNTQTDSFQYIHIRITDSDTQITGEISKLKKTQPVFITVDMWNSFILENPLESISKGRYDKKIENMCGVFSEATNIIYIRWNPEMEVPAKIYPWQGQSPVLYNKAFSHFSNLCKKWLPKAKIVWSTAGYPGVLEYFPGDDFIDYVGVTLQNASEKSTKAYPAYTSVSAETERKIHRVRFVNKPVIVFGQPQQYLDGSLRGEMEAAAQNIRKSQDLIFGTVKNPGIIKNSFNERRTSLSIGVYDPRKQLNLLPAISIEHLFPHWMNLQDGSFRKEFNAVIARNHDVIVTMEPWRDLEGKSDPDVLLNTINGQYDDRLKELFSIISNVKQTVYLRWTHEMEIPINRYPWQSQPPVTYIKAFRHFASFRNPEAKNIKIVFGPTGDRGLQDWWPGDDVVDYISMAIYGLPDKDITDYRKQESFQTIFKRKLYRMRFFDKPILISEFGIKGPEDFQLEWLMAASKTINHYPQIKAICYFNMTDTPKAWGDIEAPDWTISTETFGSFIDSLNLKNQNNSIVSN